MKIWRVSSVSLFLCLFLSVIYLPANTTFGQPCTNPQTYTIEPIPMVPDHPTVFPMEINNSGQICGRMNKGSVWQGTDYTGFFWDSDNGLIELSQVQEARGINDLGQVVGYLDPKSYFYEDLDSIIYDDPMEIPYGNIRNFAHDVNNDSWVVGHNFSTHQAYIWKKGMTPEDLGVLPGYGYNYVNAINNQKYVVGKCQTENDTMAYICDGASKEMSGLLPLGDDINSSAMDINNNGQVVGWSGVNNGQQMACMWETSGTVCVGEQYLGLVPGYESSAAADNNDSGQIVGFGLDLNASGDDTTQFIAFVWDACNGLRNLNDLIPAGSGWYLAFASGVNNAGQITGYGYLNGVQRGFIMTPVPQDTTPPVIQINNVPSITNEDVTPEIIVTDDTDPNPTVIMTLNGVAYDGGAITEEGAYILTVTAIDASDNESEQEKQFIIDKTIPQVSIDATPSILWPPNHRYVDVVVNGSATDALAGIEQVVFDVVDEYGQVEPELTDFGDSISLQASRKGKDKDGRVYTIYCSATDAAGNSITVSTTVLVPHDQGH